MFKDGCTFRTNKETKCLDLKIAAILQECICGLYFLNSVFLSLVKAADLDDVLSRPGEWTLFVPTNDAFKGLTDDDKDILISK